MLRSLLATFALLVAVDGAQAAAEPHTFREYCDAYKAGVLDAPAGLTVGQLILRTGLRDLEILTRVECQASIVLRAFLQ